VNSLYSQQGYSKVWICPRVGVTIPTGDYSGSLSDYYLGKAYGLKAGINFGVELSIPLPHMCLDLGVNYSTLGNSGSANTSSSDNIDLKQKLLIVNIGASYFPHLIHSDYFNPFFGINFLYTNIYGSVNFTGFQNVPDGSYDMQTDDRFGIGFKIGNDFQLGFGGGIEIELDYNIINAFGNNFNSGGNNGRIGSYQFLNDDKDPFYDAVDPNHPISKSRTISVIQLIFGFYIR
jgi:hypothetical protein